MELRLNFLHLLIAEMELKVERHKQRNTNLKSHCDKLRREKRNLKEALKEVAVHTHTNTHTQDKMFDSVSRYVEGGGGQVTVKGSADKQQPGELKKLL